jgi:glucan phosphoethanolaminetransferase (alkaline phosphatase superfamily)
MTTNKTPSTSYLTTLLIFAFIAVLVAPVLLIWSLNTLFGLGIAYGFFEWLAALFILGFFKQNYTKVNSSD